MKRTLLLLGFLLAPLATYCQEFDAARAFINQVQDLNPQTPVTTASAGAKPDVAAVQLANAMLDNAGAFISSPGTDASPPFLQVAITLNNNLSKRLLTKALALLVKNGTMTDLPLVINVINTYLSYPNDPPTTGFPITSPSACGQKFINLMYNFLPELLSKDYVKLLTEVMAYVLKQKQGPGGYLGTCQPDLGAVMLSLASLRCPKTGYLSWPAEDGTVIEKTACTPESRANEKSLAALLGGALISELLLSNVSLVDTNPLTNGTYNTTIYDGGRLLSFGLTRMAFAVLQTKNYTDCLANLKAYEAKIPDTTAAPRPIGPLYLSITYEGIGTLCHTVAMRTFKPDLPLANQPWSPFVGVQALMNVWLAMGQEMQNPTVKLTTDQYNRLCITMSDVLRFKGSNNAVYDMFTASQYQCVLNRNITPCPPAGVPSFANAPWYKRRPVFVLGVDLSSPKFGCKALANGR